MLLFLGGSKKDGCWSNRGQLTFSPRSLGLVLVSKSLKMAACAMISKEPRCFTECYMTSVIVCLQDDARQSFRKSELLLPQALPFEEWQSCRDVFRTRPIRSLRPASIKPTSAPPPTGILSLPSTPQQPTTTALKDNMDLPSIILHRQHLYPKAAVVFLPLPQCRQSIPPRPFGFVPATKVTKKQLCKGPQLSTMHDAVASLVESASRSHRARHYFLAPKSSSARTAPVDKPRWSCVPREESKSMAFGGEGREWGNIVTTKRLVTEHPSGGADTFLGDPCTTQASLPLGRRV